MLQGLATCGKCGRRLHTHYRGRNASPGYHCSGKDIIQGRGVYCLNVGGIQIDQAVTDAFLKALTPAAVEATEQAMRQLEADHDAALGQWRLAVERARYEAERAERQYRSVEPENRLVARGLESEWEKRLRDLAAAEAELERRQRQRPSPCRRREKESVLSVPISRKVWTAPTTTDRDRKELLRTLLEEVIVSVHRAGTSRPFDAALARRRHSSRSILHLPRSPATRPSYRAKIRSRCLPRLGGPVSRRGHRRRPESSGTQDGDRRTVYRQSGGQPAALSRHTAFPATGATSSRRSRTHPQSRANPRHEHLYYPSLAGRGLHRRRTSYARSAMADPHHRRTASTHRGAGPAELSAHVGNNYQTRRFAPDSVAACKAWRTPSHAGYLRPTQRLANQTGGRSTRPIRRYFMNLGAV